MRAVLGMMANASPHALRDSTRIAKAAGWGRSTKYRLLFFSKDVLESLSGNHHCPE
jgi:hypothetical protein